MKNNGNNKIKDMRIFETEQENFWAGEFGSFYISRNESEELIASNLNFFSQTLRSIGKIDSCIEFGANIGMNIRALKLLLPSLKVSAIEINKDAVKELCRNVDEDRIFNGSIFDYDKSDKFDLVLTKGVLIHINPDKLKEVYEKLFAVCSKYILIAEYYNPVPVAIPYRGHNDKLFKRDFAGEIMETFPSLKLADYGFCYRRDTLFPQDDITWFLLEKTT